MNSPEIFALASNETKLSEASFTADVIFLAILGFESAAKSGMATSDVSAMP